MTRSIILGLVAVALLALPAPAAATIYHVNTPSDHVLDGCADPPGDCTIRDALNSIDGPGDSVSVPAGDYQLTEGALFLNNGSLAGAGAGVTIIRGDSGDRVFEVSSVNSTSISGVTLTGGDASALSPAQGGGILVPLGGTLELSDSVVTGNTATEGGGVYAGGSVSILDSTISGNTVTSQGGGLYANAPMDIEGTTISGNTAGSGPGSSGAGMYILNNGVVSLTNSTVAQNTAPGVGTSGGAIFNNGELTLSNVTIARNGATGSALYTQPTAPAELRNTIVASDTGAACEGASAISGDHNIADDSSCGSALAVANPLLGVLANNGGPTATLALGALSPAINAGVDCPGTDQRGVARSGACDIGAYEFGLPRLTVVTTVVNDDGGTKTPANLAVRVLRGSGDVAGSPAPGTASGRSYTLATGSYAIASWLAGYTVAYGGECSPAGGVTLAENDAKTCTVVANDVAAAPQPPQLPAPKAHKTANLLRASGTVKIKRPKSKRFTTLKAGEQVPLGTIVDTRRGRVRLVAASDTKGHTASAVFYDGIFKIAQTKGQRPITVLTLVEKLTGCKTGKGEGSAAAKKKKTRRLWGDGKGRFRTKGKHSAATVVGTKWLVEDRCTSTLTKVARGKVSVRDFVKRKTVIVKKGKRYIARAK